MRLPTPPEGGSFCPAQSRFENLDFPVEGPAQRARPVFPLFGHGITGTRRLVHAIREDSSLKPLTRLQAVKWAILDNIRRPICLAVGCRFDTPVFQSNRLYFCTRCTREMFGRTFADLQPEPWSEEDDWFMGDHE